MTTGSDSCSDAEAKELSRLDDPTFRERCVKLVQRGDLQNNLLLLAMLGGGPSGALLVAAFADSSSRLGHHAPLYFAIPYAMTVFALSLGTLASSFFCRNYFLLDPVEQRLYHQVQLFRWRRPRIVFRQGEIFAILPDGQLMRNQYASYWVYRLTAVGIDGRQEPLSTWGRESLETCNARAATLAKQLGCQSYAAPPKSSLWVELKGGAPVLRYGPAHPPDFRLRVSRKFVLWLLIPLIIVFALLYYLIRIQTR